MDEKQAVPPPPEAKSVTVDPKMTALLVLDIQTQNCNPERRPRCVASLPSIQRLLRQARDKGMVVVYSLTRDAKETDIRSEVAPTGSEPVVKSGPDKFFGTDLETILKDRGVTTVITVGTAANGAVLYTASGAAFRGLKVVVPTDGMSADDVFSEHYTAWHLANAPLVGRQVTISRCDLIQF
jgi:nicotinamidase-related amidase